MRIVNNLILTILIKIARWRGKYKFRKWVILEGWKEKILGAVEHGQAEFPDYLLMYISTAWGIPSKWFEQADWLKVVEAFYVCLSKSPIVKLPITASTSEKIKDDPWTYDGRTWHLYSHLIAKEYGWSMKEISQLPVHDALAIIQEIMVDKQLDREFLYGLSEIAYPYDSGSKKSTFKPMQRPHWMKEQIQPIPRFKIPASMLPVGVVMMDKVLPDEYLPKEIKS